MRERRQRDLLWLAAPSCPPPVRCCAPAKDAPLPFGVAAVQWYTTSLRYSGPPLNARRRFTANRRYLIANCRRSMAVVRGAPTAGAGPCLVIANDIISMGVLLDHLIGCRVHWGSRVSNFAGGSVERAKGGGGGWEEGSIDRTNKQS